MFSERTGWNRTPNRLSAVLATHRRERGEVLDLTESNPTSVGLPDCQERLAETLVSPGLGRYRPDPLGLATAREAIVAMLAVRGIQTRPDRIVLTASSSEAYSYLFKLLCDPGDSVLVPAPSYPLFEFLADVECVRTRRYPLRWDGQWHVDRGALSEALEPGTRAIVVVNPNNPTGHYVGDDAPWLDDFCARSGLALITDEVFLDYDLGPGIAAAPGHGRSVLSGPGPRPTLTVALGGLSKGLGLPGFKLGWMVLDGPSEVVNEAMARLELIADTFLSVGSPVQRACTRLLTDLESYQAPIRNRVRRNHETLGAVIPSNRPWRPLGVEAGWYQVIEIPALTTEDDLVCELLASEEVWVQPGYFYEFGRDGHLVLSLLPTPEIFDEGIRRLIRFLDRRFAI